MNAVEKLKQIRESLDWSAKQINEQYKARQAFWNVALGNNSKLANLAKLAIDEVEKLGQDEVDIRSRLYQRIHELETQLAQPEQKYTVHRNPWTGKATYTCNSCGCDDFRSEHGAYAHKCSNEIKD